MKLQQDMGSFVYNQSLLRKAKRYAGLLVFLVLFVIANSCKTTKLTSSKVKEEGTVTFKIIQLNDVYEIAPLSGGQYGGMARVAHVKDSVAKVNPNTYLVMAGDFLNPSLLGTIKVVRTTKWKTYG